MRLHFFQHVWFEDLGVIKDWALDNGFAITRTAFYENESLPDLNDIDWLVIMGGPMNIYEVDKYSWLVEEKEFIKRAIDGGKKVLGICLGAQLIADVLGAKVTKGKHKEIGWFPVRFDNIKDSQVFKDFPNEVTVFHWHGDTFGIPLNAVHVAESDACSNQAFFYNCGKVIGLQFHFELKEQGIRRLVEQCSDEISLGDYVQKPEDIIAGISNINTNNALMIRFLSNLKRIK